MPVIVFLLLVLLIAQIGFWGVLKAIIGAVGMIVLLIALAGGLILFGGYLFVRSVNRRM